MSITLTHPVDGSFQEALSGHVTTVCVITCRDLDGRPIGMTATAFAVASQDPPRVVVCVNSESRTYDAIGERGSFGINFLGDDAAEVSSYCARPGANKELASAWLAATDNRASPALRGASGFLDCAVETEVKAGPGAVIIGRPTIYGTQADPTGPLLFSRGRYHRIGRELA